MTEAGLDYVVFCVSYAYQDLNVRIKHNDERKGGTYRQPQKKHSHGQLENRHQGRVDCPS